MKKISLYLTLLLLSFILVSCSVDGENKFDTVTVNFNVTLPSTTPNGDNIQIVGDLKHPNTETWDDGLSNPNQTLIKNGNVATFTLVYKLDELPLTIQYKYTRGNSWDFVEKGINGQEIPNRTLKITTLNEFIEVNDTVGSWADMLAEIPHGTVVGNLDVFKIGDRFIRVWTPDSYDNNDSSKKYPVIYLQDGQNVFDSKTAFGGSEWQADETMAALMSDGFTGAIIVGIDNSSQRMGEYVPEHSFLKEAVAGATRTGLSYMTYVTEQVIPYVNDNYQTLTEREHTTIGGSSLGSIISLFGGLEHLNVFGNILAFSTSTQLVTESKLDNYFDSKKPLITETRFFIYVGTDSDGSLTFPETVKTKLKNIDVPDSNIQTFVGQNHSHNEFAWRTHLPIALKWLFNLN